VESGKFEGRVVEVLEKIENYGLKIENPKGVFTYWGKLPANFKNGDPIKPGDYAIGSWFKNEDGYWTIEDQPSRFDMPVTGKTVECEAGTPYKPATEEADPHDVFFTNFGRFRSTLIEKFPKVAEKPQAAVKLYCAYMMSKK
jgi:hypothetical protein